ncbi:MAG: ABC transporter permease [Verrucomicrobiota bacterium]
MDTIPNQTKLPLKVALEIVLQGIRIRLGRSLVTVSGVVLGVAFLMSILAGILLKAGVSEEDAARLELERMTNFLEAETGVLEGKSLGVIVTGEVSVIEGRFLRTLERAGVERIRYFDPEGFLDPGELRFLESAGIEDIATGASGVLLMGEAADAETLVLPGDIPVADLLVNARQRLLAATRPDIRLPEAPGITTTRLSRELKQAEIKAMAERERRDRFRDIWIIVISLMVTVIGIANAMLMSVTERFREIGTMKCLGALSSFVRRMFLIESAIMGLAGGLVGAVGGILFSILAYLLTYGVPLVLAGLASNLAGLIGFGLLAVAAGVILSMFAALYPAQVAARMIPAVALRSNV